MWWDIRKLGEPVETLPLEFPGYRPGQMLGGIALEYESSMVRIKLACPYTYVPVLPFHPLVR